MDSGLYQNLKLRIVGVLGENLFAFLQKKIPILFILLYIDLSPRSRYVHQDSVKLLYPAGLAWATALPCCGARRFVF